MSEEDYLAYKKNKLKEQNEEKEKRISKRVIAVIFLVTFVVCFFVVMNAITKYGAKIDIEYGRAIQPSSGTLDMDGPFVKGTSPMNDFIDDRKTQIDSRLKVLQLEETAPSEARIVGSNKDKVLDIENYKKLIGEQKAQKEAEVVKLAQQREEAVKPAPPPPPPKVIVSKVLIGRYNSFDEARLAQNNLKEDNGTITFIRKMGEIYSLQVGSYTEETAAQNIANKYHEAGHSVWILQD